MKKQDIKDGVGFKFKDDVLNRTYNIKMFRSEYCVCILNNSSRWEFVCNIKEIGEAGFSWYKVVMNQLTQGYTKFDELEKIEKSE